jgi:hypothetical protein
VSAFKPLIAVTNHSTVVNDTDVAKAVNAIQIQVSRDFAALWGVDAYLQFHAYEVDVPGAWRIGIFDDSDQADALGYHDFTADGLPLGKVFAKTTIDDGASWTVCFSHETLEMLGDPDIVRAVFVQDTDKSGIMYAYEVCDAVEADELGYDINDTLVSDFVTPKWFQVGQKGLMSHMASVKEALELAPGGYISYFRVPNHSGWEQKFAATAPAHGKMAAQLPKHRDPRGHRHERRMRRSAPVLSTAR